VADLLSRLVDKSLVVADTGEDGTARYRLLETVRQFGRDRLLESGEGAALRERHLGFFEGVAAATYPRLWGPEMGTGFARLEADWDNFRAALAWLWESGQAQAPERELSLVRILGRFWATRGYVREGRQYDRHALERAEACPHLSHSPLRGHVLRSAAWVADLCDEPAEARRLYEEAVAVFQAAGAPEEEIWARFRLGQHILARENPAEGRRVLEALLAQHPHSPHRGVALSALGNLALRRGNLEQARVYLEQALALYRETKNPESIANTLASLGGVCVREGQYARAQTLLGEALRIDARIRAPIRIGEHLTGFVRLGLQRGQYRRAVTLAGASEALIKGAGAVWADDDRPQTDENMAHARAALGAEAFARAWQAGRLMDLERAVAYGLSDTPADAATDALTAEEVGPHPGA
jgi:non-specific serine/threonine protein kinase